MAGFILNFDAHMLMLEVLIHRLTVPSSCPFDAVINSKYIVSFNFINDDWIDIMPQRTDYKTYCGSTGEEHWFHGGKSMVFPIAAVDLCDECCGLTVDLHVRREVSPYFEIDTNVMDVGKLSVNVDDLFNSIVQELRLRRELGDCLKLPHDKDPICMSIRHEYLLKDPDTDETTDGKILFWLRLSHLGNNIITDIDMPSSKDCSFFYAQEQSNREQQYELKEIGCNSPPITERPVFSKVKDCAEFVCTCSSDQKLQLLMDLSIGISTVSTIPTCSSTCPSDDPDCRDRGVGTRDNSFDKGNGTGEGDGDRDGHGEDDEFADDANAGKRKKRRGAGQAILFEKCVPCEPCCIPCDPCDPCCIPCEPCAPCVTFCVPYCAYMPEPAGAC